MGQRLWCRLHYGRWGKMIDSDHLAAFLAWLRDVRQDYDMALAEADFLQEEQ